MTRASELRDLNDEELAHIWWRRGRSFFPSLPVGHGEAGQLGTHRPSPPRGRPGAHPPAGARQAPAKRQGGGPMSSTSDNVPAEGAALSGAGGYCW